MIGWSFPPNNYGVNAGANDGAIDAFAGTRLSSVVREIILLWTLAILDLPAYRFSRMWLEAISHICWIKPHLEGSETQLMSRI